MKSDPPPGTIDSIRSAARMGDFEKLKLLSIEWNGHPVLNDRNGDMMGLAPLHWAVAAGQSKGRLQCISVLLDAGANIETTNNGGKYHLLFTIIIQNALILIIQP